MRIQIWKTLRLFAFCGLLGVGAGCHSYGSKEVAVYLKTSPQQLSDSARTEAYIVKIEGWSDLMQREHLRYSANPADSSVDPGQEYAPPCITPKDPPEFRKEIEQYRVQKWSPPDWKTRTLPYHAIYVVRIGDTYYWEDIEPTFNSPNQFDLKVNPDAAKSQ